MLLQSHAGEIELLPALPGEWSSGSVSGLRARGGFEVTMAWKNGKLTSSSIKSITGASATVRYSEKTIGIKLKRGEVIYLNDGLVPVKNI